MTKSRCSGVMLENGMYRARSCFSPDAIVGAAMRCSLEVGRSAREARSSVAGASGGAQRPFVPLVPSPAVVGLAIDALPDSVHAEPDVSTIGLAHLMPGL